MKDYVAENERILNEWCKKFVEEKKHDEAYRGYVIERYFAKDGIMFKGEIVPKPIKYENGDEVFRWERKPSGKENELWSKEPLRVLFLTKDQNTSGDVAWDVRGETFRYPDVKYQPNAMCLYTQNTFFRNLVYSFYGIMKTIAGCPKNYDDFTNEEALALADEMIFARINCKKEVGSDKCYDNVLRNAIENDKMFLKQQIENLDADIFMCCSYSQSIENTGNRMLNLLIEIGYQFKPEVEDWIYYDEKRNKIAINSYHLSFPQFNYQGMVSAYSEFLKKHPDFTKSHR